MSAAAIGLIMFGVMIALVFIGFPVYVTMFFTSMIGILWMNGPVMLLAQFTNGPFSLSASYNYAVMPMFTLLGILAGETGIAQGAYYSMHTLLSRQRGNLLYTTIAANAIFGACSGNGNASSIVFAKIALPEMRRYGYDEKLSLGCVTASGALAGLIPPSIPIVQISILAGYSIGTALIYGLSTGILTTLMMCFIVWIVSLVNPKKVPPVSEEDKKITFRQKLGSLKLLVPIALLFALIIGGSFFGWFHPTIGGAIGAAVCVVYALAKRVPVKRVLSAAWESAHIFAGTYLIIVSGTMFSRMISLSGLTNMLVGLIEKSQLPRAGIILFVILAYVLAGCVMDILAVIVVSVPVVFPILVGALGFDPYILIMIVVMAGCIGGITPPIGVGVFTIANVTRIPTERIFKGVLPFVITEILVCLLITWAPKAVSWLPDILSKLG